MDESSAVLYILIVICVALSAFFSASETAFSSVSMVRLRNLADNGNKKAKKALRIAEDYNRTLSAVLIGNNIVNIASASLGTVIFTFWFGASGAGISTLVMTIVVLIFGEVLPKTLAKKNAEQYALFTANILRILVIVFSPLIFLLSLIQNIATRKADGEGEHQPKMTEQELKYIIEESENEGVLEQSESELVQSALDFDETIVEEVLTPRVDVVAIEEHETADTVRDLFFSSGYSRLPVYRGNIDTVVGVIHSKDFFEAYLTDRDAAVSSILQPVAYVPSQMRISELMQELKKRKSHMAIVIDEYGGTIGIITLEDILEELVGDIWDESDEVSYDIEKIEENLYHVAGDVDPEDFFETVGFEQTQSEMDALPNSFAGWALEELERIPDPGDRFCYQNLCMEVLEVAEQRILKLKVEIQEQKTEEE